MKKVYKIEGVDCANCAAKLENGISKIDGVCSVNYNFMGQKLSFEIEHDSDFEAKIREVNEFIKKKEPEAVLSEEDIYFENRKVVIFTKNPEEDLKRFISKRIYAIDGIENLKFNDEEKTLQFTIKKGGDENSILLQVNNEITDILKSSSIKFRGNYNIKTNYEEKINKISLFAGILFFLFGILFNSGENEKFIYITAYFLIGWEIIYSAFKKITRKEFLDENFLMVTATIGAFSIGEYSEAVGVMLFYKIGEFFQEKAVQNSKKSIKSLLSMKKESVRVLGSDGVEVEKNVESISIGEILIVRPGEIVAADGIVIEGESDVDISNITGEFMPLEVSRGSELLAGYINRSGILKVKTEKDYKNSTVAKILNLVENSTEKKSKSENFITKFARIYTPAVVAGAALTAIIPISFGGDPETWIYRALIFLVVSCPCALVISIPLSYFVGIGRAAKAGILVKGSNYLEALSNVKNFIFDKTGTLSKGKLKVIEAKAENISMEEFLKALAYAEYYSTHPIARTVIEYAGIKVDTQKIASFKEIAGMGVIAEIEGSQVAVGNKKLMEKIEADYSSGNSNMTILYVAINGKFAGKIAISDELKEDAEATVAKLKNMGIDVFMLTGDRKEAAVESASKLGIKEYFAELLPEDKVSVYEKIASKGRKSVFVGDGVNDAPVLARADIGISMGSAGSDAAIEASDIVIIGDEVKKCSDAVKIAVTTKRIVIQNIVFALSVKIGVIILGLFGIANMWTAVFADVGVALIAILNASRGIK